MALSLSSAVLTASLSLLSHMLAVPARMRDSGFCRHTCNFQPSAYHPRKLALTASWFQRGDKKGLMKGRWEAVCSLRPEGVRMWLLETGETRPKIFEGGMHLLPTCSLQTGSWGTAILTFSLSTSSLLLVLPTGQTFWKPEGKKA